MSWSPANLYNLFQRSYGPPTSATTFTKSSKTLFQQKWTAKQLTRAYHGDWIEEGKFKKAFMPDHLPQLTGTRGKEEARVPLASMMFAEVEKRIDTVVFRCCFADSVYRARMMVVHGNVKLNGKKHMDPNTKLQPGDLISIDPSAVTTLQPPKPNEAAYKAFVKASSTASPSPSLDAAEPVDADADADAAPSTPSTTPEPSALRTPLPFHLPEYASPFLFIPPYLEPSFQTCSAVYLRHPTAGPGHSEVPSPYEADGEVMRLTWEYYANLGRKGDTRPKSLIGKRLGS
ncbi:hypothetical protein RQP46_006401 [Phenoliferia psychrophenolica]